MDLITRIKTSLAAHTRLELSAGPVPAAVLVPLFLKNSAYHILFTKRTQNLTHHRGQVSFPGGVQQPEDRDSLQTALRETWEEVGISPAEVEILGVLDDFLSIQNFLVTPFVGMVAGGYRLRVNPAEIERIIEIPLNFLLRPDIFRIEELNWQGRTYPLYSIDFEGDKIWGLTAAILKQFLEVIAIKGEERLRE